MTKHSKLIPHYVSQFKCIGGACEDTCCAGWRVTIDEETYKKYRRVETPQLRKRLESNVIRQRSNNSFYQAAKMKLINGRCSFLNESGWCDIHTELGETYLCHTCKTYPRIINKVNNCFEYALTTSCPEAARLILLNKDGIDFSYEEECQNHIVNVNCEVQLATNNPQRVQDYLAEIRYVMISILQARDYSLQNRLLILGLLFEELNEIALKDVPMVLGQYLDLLETNSLEDAFNKINATFAQQLQLGRDLVVLRLKTSIASGRYLECSREMLEGLKLDQNLSHKELECIYKEAYQQYYQPFMTAHEYMLENYFVNYIIKNSVPIDTANIFDSYAKMIIHYLIIKLHLVGIGAKYKGLKEEDVVKLVQSMSKTFEHNTKYFDKIMELMKQNNLMTLEIMTQLIKN